MSGSSSAAAERYARAIFELGSESGDVASLAQQIGEFAATYAASADLRSVLENPMVTAEQREQILRQVAGRVGLGPLALTSIRYLASRRRLRLLPELARHLGKLFDAKRGVVRASVTSAGPLPEAFFERLTRELETLVGKSIALERHEDASLIAGVITRIGDNTIDGSLRGRLENLHRQLLA